MNLWIITGNLARDPQAGTTASGAEYCHITVAVNQPKHRGASAEPPAMFVNVTAWGDAASYCMAYLHKGSKVLVRGRPEEATIYKARNGEQRASLNMTADSYGVEFLSPKGDDGGYRQADDVEGAS